MFDPVTVYLRSEIPLFLSYGHSLLIYRVICYYAGFQTINAATAQKIEQQENSIVNSRG